MLALFLDFDGVLNSWQSIHYFERKRKAGAELLKHGYENFCPIAISNLNNLMEDFPDLLIVVCSTWRLYHSVTELGEILAKNGFLYPEKIMGKTPDLGDCPRGKEIKHWMDEFSTAFDIKEFVIIDDDTDMEPVMDHLVRTDQRTGLDWFVFDKVVDLFEAKGFKSANKIGVAAL